MPEAIVKDVEKRCNAGRLPKWLRKLKAEKSLSCNQLGEAVAAMVSAKRKRAAKAGETTELTFYGGEIEQTVWVLANEPSTLVNGVAGGRYEVEQTAHLANLPAWSKVTKGFIDHNKEKGVSLEIRNAAFNLDRGLFLEVFTEDDSILSGLRSGSVLPSIEIVTDEECIDDISISNYKPTGLGLMIDKEPMGNNVGPETPPVNSISLYAGKVDKMPNKPNEDGEAPAPEEDALPKDEKKPDASPKEKSTTDEAKTEEVNKITSLEKELAGLRSTLEAVTKSDDSKSAAVNELKQIYINTLPENARELAKEQSLDTLKLLSSVSEGLKLQYEEFGAKMKTSFAPIIKESDPGAKPDKVVASDGQVTDEDFNAFLKEKGISLETLR